MDIDKLIHVYIKLRDEKSRIRKEADAQCADIQAKIDRIGAELQRHLNNTNSELVRASTGTAYRKEVLKPNVRDWSAFDNFLEVAGVSPSDAYEKRVSRAFVEAYMDQHEGTPPDGVSVYREFVVEVRRSKN